MQQTSSSANSFTINEKHKSQAESQKALCLARVKLVFIRVGIPSVRRPALVKHSNCLKWQHQCRDNDMQYKEVGFGFGIIVRRTLGASKLQSSENSALNRLISLLFLSFPASWISLRGTISLTLCKNMYFPNVQRKQSCSQFGSSQTRLLFSARRSVQLENSLLPPLSPSISISPKAQTASAGSRSTHTALEKGLGLISKVFGPVPPLPERDKKKEEYAVNLSATDSKKEAESACTKPSQQSTLLDLQAFEVHLPLRRRTNMSLSSIPSVIKLKITPASPRYKLRRASTHNETMSSFSHSPKTRPGQLPHFPFPTLGVS